MKELLQPLADDLVSYCQKHIGFENPPSLFFQDDEENAQNVFGKTAHYSPSERVITVFTTNRHPKDVLRSIAHELVHHKQNTQGFFDKIEPLSDGYAQDNPHLRNMEKQAYLVGNITFRDWEDSLKKKHKENNIMVKITEAFENKGDSTMLIERIKKEVRKILEQEEVGADPNEEDEETSENGTDEDFGTSTEVPHSNGVVEEGHEEDDEDDEDEEEDLAEGLTPEWEKLIDKNRFEKRRNELFNKLMKKFMK